MQKEKKVDERIIFNLFFAFVLVSNLMVYVRTDGNNPSIENGLLSLYSLADSIGLSRDMVTAGLVGSSVYFGVTFYTLLDKKMRGK